MENNTSSTPTPEIVTQKLEEKPKKNLYPFVRHLFFGSIALLVFLILVYLVYYNGKSIYENGL